MIMMAESQSSLRQRTGTAKSPRWHVVVLSLLLLVESIRIAEGWSSLMKLRSRVRAETPYSRASKSLRDDAFRLFALQDSTTDDTYDDDETSRSASRPDREAASLRRLGMTGVSVSEGGFTVLWSLASDTSETVYWPWRVTTPQAGDKVEATSPQALTLCQLIAGVDLAGSRFPPDMLAQLAILHLEASETEDTTTLKLVGEVHRQLHAVRQQWFPKEAAAASEPLSYWQAPQWTRARVRLPLCTLDQIVVEPAGDRFKVSLHIQARDYGRLILSDVTDEAVADVFEPLYDAYTFSDQTRLGFLTTALALRYKAPVLLQSVADKTLELVTDAQIQEQFPYWTTVQKVQSPSDRVVSNIVKGWEVHQLQAAYQIALQKQDAGAVAKIREKLDEMDQLPDLPVQAEFSDSELDSMQ